MEGAGRSYAIECRCACVEPLSSVEGEAGIREGWGEGSSERFPLLSRCEWIEVRCFISIRTSAY